MDAVGSPFELAGLEAATVEQIMVSFDGRSDARDFRRAARLNAAKASSADPLFLATHDVDVSSPQRAINGTARKWHVAHVIPHRPLLSFAYR